MVKVGDVVQRGDVIAYIGSTGSSTGPHVHYEVWKSSKPANPKTYLKAGDRG
jgi:murein DD-endopeptidase MepM/ murein hydrolase activator NlpD